jgi:glycosyltransferase involved in cell wall biosynthesis
MRIGLNGLFLHKPMTGSGQYTYHLWKELLALDHDDEFVLLSDRASDVSAGLAASSHSRLLVSPSPLPGLPENLDKLGWEQLGLPIAGRRARLDLIHSPYFAGPVASSSKLVITIHDLIPMVLPQYAGSRMVRWYTRLVRLAARRADAIIADSECSKRDIVRLLRIAPEKVQVIYLAASEECRPLGDPAELEAIRRKYDLPERFFLYVGGLDARKNVPRLIQAFGRARKRLEAPCPLAIAGRPESENSEMFPDLLAVARENAVDGDIIFLGRVPEEDKTPLYGAALAFLFPSLYEGFGLTPLEALACGAPVVSSNASSLSEVVGDAAILVDPLDVDGLAGAIVALATNQELRASLREKGLAQAARFSWRRAAEQTLAVYRSTLGV